VKKIRPNIKYRDAWEAYDRRWALAWAGTLIFALALWFTVAGPRGETSPLPLIGAVLLFFLLYLRFMLWRCPAADTFSRSRASAVLPGDANAKAVIFSGQKSELPTR
jgi:hypothetical protein